MPVNFKFTSNYHPMRLPLTGDLVFHFAWRAKLPCDGLHEDAMLLQQLFLLNLEALCMIPGRENKH